PHALLVLLLLLPPPPPSTLFPYTTLFRSTLVRALQGALRPTGGSVTFNDRPVHRLPRRESKQFKAAVRFTSQDSLTVTDLRLTRSEEHTSELQSRENLVCRLLLEKKKKQT